MLDCLHGPGGYNFAMEFRTPSTPKPFASTPSPIARRRRCASFCWCLLLWPCIRSGMTFPRWRKPFMSFVNVAERMISAGRQGAD